VTKVTTTRNEPATRAGYPPGNPVPGGRVTAQPSPTSLLKRLRDRVLCALQDRPEAILWPRRGAPRSLPPCDDDDTDAARRPEGPEPAAPHDPMAGW